MKKALSLVLALAMAVTLLAGCAADKAPSSTDPVPKQEGKATELVLWYWSRSLDDKLLEQVSTQFPDVTLKAEKISELKTKIITCMAAGSGLPDIMMVNDWLPDLMTNSDAFANLLEAPFNAGELEADFYDWKWDMCFTADKKQMVALPVDTGPTALFYRADLFEKAGLPSEPEEVAKQFDTWEKLIGASQQLTDKTGSKMFENLQRIFIYSMSQEDKLYLDRDGSFIGDQPHVRKCFDLAIEVNKGKYAYNVDNWTPEWNAAIDNGDIACFPGAYWMKQILYDASTSTKGNWRVTDMPGGAGNNGGSFISIPASSQHKEQAFKVIKWLTCPENQAYHLRETALFPSTAKAFELNKDVINEDYFGGQDTTKVFAKAAGNVPTAYNGPKMGAFQDIFAEQLKMVADQGKDSEKAWTDAVAKCKEEMTR
ncbi:MAG: extracellular solute-binding protein [Angelakisella sp.]